LSQKHDVVPFDDFASRLSVGYIRENIFAYVAMRFDLFHSLLKITTYLKQVAFSLCCFYFYSLGEPFHVDGFGNDFILFY